jgi:ASC-1-like (ASCH) protein
MRHEMRLNESPFKGIKSGRQKYETRLLDEKRRMINVGDTIIFSKRPNLSEKIEVKVVKIVKASNFEQLFKKILPVEANYPPDFTPKDCGNNMLKYYTIEDQEKYGVVAFRVKPL